MAYTICLNGQPITESAWTLESEAEAAMQRLIATELNSQDSIITPEALEVLPCETDREGFAIGPPPSYRPPESAAQFAAAMWSEQCAALRKENLALHAAAERAAAEHKATSPLPDNNPLPELLDDSTLAIAAAILVQPHIDKAAVFQK